MKSCSAYILFFLLLSDRYFTYLLDVCLLSNEDIATDVWSFRHFPQSGVNENNCCNLPGEMCNACLQPREIKGGPVEIQ